LHALHAPAWVEPQVSPSVVRLQVPVSVLVCGLAQVSAAQL
jgi:hypothetical protein